jgi:DNA (cytosine-5)-methyltransferase 1
MKYVELFSCIGGLRRAVGLLSKDTKIKFDCIGFSEIDQHAIKTYSSNYNLNGETFMHDLTDFVQDKSKLRRMEKLDLLLGGFPCQSFSIYGKKLGLEDERGRVLFSIEKILNTKKPKFIVLENVRNIIRHDNGRTIQIMQDYFKGHGYRYVNYTIHNSMNFGLPQNRSRIFIVCCKKKIDFELSENAIIENYKRIRKHSLCTYKNVLSIIEKKVDSKYYLSEKIKHAILDGGTKSFWSKSQIDLDITRTLTATMVKLHRACQDNYYSDDFILRGESHKDTPKEYLFNKPIRRLTPKEALMLQGFSKSFYQRARAAGVSDLQLYKQAGNALSVNTGYALLHYLFVNLQLQNS